MSTDKVFLLFFFSTLKIIAFADSNIDSVILKLEKKLFDASFEDEIDVDNTTEVESKKTFHTSKIQVTPDYKSELDSISNKMDALDKSLKKIGSLFLEKKNQLANDSLETKSIKVTLQAKKHILIQKIELNLDDFVIFDHDFFDKNNRSENLELLNGNVLVQDNDTLVSIHVWIKDDETDLSKKETYQIISKNLKLDTKSKNLHLEFYLNKSGLTSNLLEIN